MLHAFVLIDAEPSRIAALCEELADSDGITEVFSVAGGVADIIAIVRVRHQELPTVAMDAVPGTPFPLLPLLLFSTSVGPVFDPPGVALLLTLPGFEGSFPSFPGAGGGRSESPGKRGIVGMPSLRW